MSERISEKRLIELHNEFDQMGTEELSLDTCANTDGYEVSQSLRELLALRTAAEGMKKALEKIRKLRGSTDPCPYSGEADNHSSGDCIECTAKSALAAYRKALGR